MPCRDGGPSWDDTKKKIEIEALQIALKIDRKKLDNVTRLLCWAVNNLNVPKNRQKAKELDELFEWYEEHKKEDAARIAQEKWMKEVEAKAELKKAESEVAKAEYELKQAQERLDYVKSKK